MRLIIVRHAYNTFEIDINLVSVAYTVLVANLVAYLSAPRMSDDSNYTLSDRSRAVKIYQSFVRINAIATCDFTADGVISNLN